ncbi:MAG: methyl-accepting chemotaxis protein [Alphaproteobacteria bacterium]
MSTQTSSAKSGRFGVFANLPVKAKIMAGFALVLVLFAIVGVVSYSSLQSIDEDFVTYENRVAVVDIARDIDADFTTVRVAVRKFVQTGEDADAAAVEAAVDKVHEHVARGLETSSNPERRGLLEEIEGKITAYAAGFANLVTLKHKEDGLVAETLNPTGAGLTAALKDVRDAAAAAGNSNALILAGTALQEVMEVRIDVLKALGGHDTEAGERVETQLAEVETAIAGLDKAVAGSALAETVQSVDEMIVTYHETFTRLEEVDHEVIALIDGEMKAGAEEIGALAGKIVESGTTDRNALQDQATADMASTTTLVLTLLVGGVGLGLALAWFTGGAIAKPISQATGLIEKLAAGDDNIEVAATQRKDEIGRLWRAMGSLKTTVSEAFRLKQMVDDMPLNVMLADPEDGFKITYMNKTSEATLRTIEDALPVKAAEIKGSTVEVFKTERRTVSDPNNLPWNSKVKLGSETLDLKVSAIWDKNGKYVGPMLAWNVVTRQVKQIDDFEANVKVVVDTVASASTELQSSAQSMSATAEETNRQAGAVAAASEEATTNVQTVASASEELAASISEIGRQVAQSASIASMAVDEAKRTDATVQGLSEAAQKIGEVVSLISDIASQTNLLALNATIEAARAGEAGKGFAVVASEVKSLANQTAKATEEIAAQIGAIQGSTKEAVSAIQSIGKTIGEINSIASSISAAVEEQGAATREIARNVQEASQGTTEVSKNISGVTQAAGETGSAAAQVLSAADELSPQSEKLKAEVETFLQTVRAA